MPEDQAPQDSGKQIGNGAPLSAGDAASPLPRRRIPKSERENPSAAVAPFIQRIQQDTDAEIERIRDKGELSAKRKLEEAQREAESALRLATKSANDQARRIESRTLSGVSLETRRTLLRVEGEIVSEVLERARKRLADFREKAEYADFLKSLAVEGIVAIEDDTCVLVPAAADAVLFTPQRVAEIKRIAERRTGREMNLTLSNDPSIEGFGVRVYSASRKTLFDNTVAARLERLADVLRMIVVKEVFDRPAPDPSGVSGQQHR